MNNLFRLISLTAILTLGFIPIHAQNFMIQTESDFGKSVIFADGMRSLDDPGYTYTKLDEQRLVIRYKTFLSFADNKDEGLRDDMILQVGGRISKYYSPLLHSADSALHTGGQQMTLRNNLFSKANPVFINDCYYTDLSSGTLTFVCRLVTEDYEYTETLSPIDWTISDDTKLVCGHECRKATGRFRERTYEAWFTEDIPSSVGPWKLRGLPGAILFAEDTDGLCRFEAISVTYTPDIIEKTEYPYIKITRKEYATMLKQYFKTPGRFRSMHMSMAPGIKVITAGKETPLRSIVILEKD